MMAEQRKIWYTKVKKLALSYNTGWEYLPESEEAGSILTDIFLEMELENKRRLGRIWEKQEQEFLKIVPKREEDPRRLETALSVRAGESGDGQWIASDTRAYTVTEQGMLIGFRTVSPVRLTAARLSWIIRRSGLWAWLCCGGEDDFPVSFLPSEDRLLAYPVFRWCFSGAWGGHGSFSFTAEFQEEPDSGLALPGRWSVSDGRHVYPAVWKQSSQGFSLSGECPEFTANLEANVYELKLELTMGDELPDKWLKALTGGLILKEAAADVEPTLCLTDNGVCGSGGILPFGGNPEEGACFYLACDRAVGGGKFILRFMERYETEEKLPEPESKEYRKLYKKYPWLKRRDQIREWQAEETCWEYFNGRFWHPLPGSESWKTGCRPEEPGERRHCFSVPRDLAPCFVEGEEHLYLRLRINRIQGAYAPYYRKRIPVLEGICMRKEERMFKGKGLDMPTAFEAAVEKVYLGFDREINPDNCWYLGRGSRKFASEQILGYCEYYGKKAFWVEATPMDGEIETFLPNYVELRQEPGGKDETDPRQIPEKTLVYLETERMGVFNGVSVTGARYDKAGAPVRNQWAAAENYFSHFGRMMTTADMELLIQERYPYYRVADCTFDSGAAELLVTLEKVFGDAERACGEAEEDRLPEIGGWLKAALWQQGPFWLKEAGVRCVLAE